MDQPELSKKLVELKEAADKLGLKDTALYLHCALIRCGWEALELDRKLSRRNQ